MIETATPAPLDLVIAGGELVDGSGLPRRRADVGVRGDRVVEIGDLSDSKTAVRVDASGRIVAPGFVDAHTHDDRAVLSGPDMTPKVSQGVTTVIAGNCGVSLAPFTGDPPPPMNLLGDREWYRFATMREYVEAVRASPPALNIAPMVGHTALRAAVMDDLARAATGAEIDRMGALVDEALDAGCIGLSTGLAYPPAIAAPTDEVVALAGRVAARGGIYATHMRNERAGVVDSVRETLEIGRRAELPVVISHHKCSGRESWGLTRETLPLIAAARREQSVNLDVYPYTASSTVLLADWVPAAEKVLVTWSVPHPEHAGRDFASIRGEWGCSIEAAVERLHPAGAIYFQMDEADLRRIIAFEDSMIGSDGLPHDAFPHPRLWGTFPRVLGHYSRETGLLTLEQAVRKMTSVAARVFGLADRGIVREGAFADLVVFDPQAVIDAATFESPVAAATGIERVLVNGRTVWDGAAATGERPGRLLERT